MVHPRLLHGKGTCQRHTPDSNPGEFQVGLGYQVIFFREVALPDINWAALSRPRCHEQNAKANYTDTRHVQYRRSLTGMRTSSNLARTLVRKSGPQYSIPYSIDLATLNVCTTPRTERVPGVVRQCTQDVFEVTLGHACLATKGHFDGVTLRLTRSLSACPLDDYCRLAFTCRICARIRRETSRIAGE